MLTKATIATIERRSDGLCENCGKPAQDAAHITAKKMGGRQGPMKAIINDPRNLAALCRDCHDLIDFKRRELYPGERAGALEKLKAKIDWQDWEQEHHGTE
ncbi:MAG: HNH endonuclease [Planctomycetes bacterium]|nr:HNH endonuclease [Planctomycetota bacterium]